MQPLLAKKHLKTHRHSNPKPPTYRIGPAVALNVTNRHKWFVVGLICWTVFTSAMTYGVIEWSWGFRKCTVDTAQVTFKEPPKLQGQARSLKVARMANHIVKTFSVPQADANDIAYWVDLQVPHWQKKAKSKAMTTSLILAVIATESGFRLHATSGSEAKGLMQLTESSGRDTSTDLHTNINNGVSHLIDYYKELGSMDAALQAYNVGISAYKKGTRAESYLQKVKEYQKKFEIVVDANPK